MFVALLRWQAKAFGVHFKSLVWCLRREQGGRTGRWHLHATIAGFPHGPTARNCLALMSQWERLGGGIARASCYVASLEGFDYIMKGLGSSERFSKDYHELTKFGGSCEVTLSESAIPYVNRRRVWRSGLHEMRGLDTASNTERESVTSVIPVRFIGATATAITLHTSSNARLV